MKFAIVIPDGAADEPQIELSGRTPLQAAKTPHLDQLARSGLIGRVNHTPAAFPAGSDVAGLSLLGYEPARYYTGRAALEAAAQQIPLGLQDWVIRCNLVTIVDQQMRDFTAGHVSTADATTLLSYAQSKLPPQLPLRWVPGVSYRNLAVYSGLPGSPAPFSKDTRTTPPHDLMDKPVADDFPRGPGSDLLAELMRQSVEWFTDHPVNQQRLAAGRLPITNLWLWGLGQKPQLPQFRELHGCQGAMVAAVDLLRGLAELIGWPQIRVPGATGNTDTDYAGKGAAAIEALDQFDLVCVHIEAPDEASHQGNLAGKVKAIEAIDREIIGPLAAKLKTFSEWRILVSPDHPTTLASKTHTHGDVPFLAAGTGFEHSSTEQGFHEASAADSALVYLAGHLLLSDFLAGRLTPRAN